MNLDEIGWSISEGMHEQMPIILRYRNLEQSFPRNNYPQRLNIFWNFATPTMQGLPSPNDSSFVRLFEDRLVEAVESDGHSVLSMILTGKGQREFVFHTSNVSEFLQRLMEMPQEKERYPIEIDTFTDEKWDYVDRVIEGILKK